MTIEEVKAMLRSAQSIDREVTRMKEEIEKRREELLSVRSSMNSERILSCEKLSMPERVYFALEKLYEQYSDALQRQYEYREHINEAISALDPLEQEIVRAWIDGKTEEEIGSQVGYSRRSIQYKKRRILLRLAEL